MPQDCVKPMVYILLASFAIFMFTFLLFSSPISAFLSQRKQLDLYNGLVINHTKTISASLTTRSYVPRQFLYPYYLTLIAVFCIYKAFIKYRLIFKVPLNCLKQVSLYGDYKFRFIAKDHIPGLFDGTEVRGSVSRDNQESLCPHLQKKASNYPSRILPNNNINVAPKRIRHKQKETMKKTPMDTISDEWTVVTAENKKKKNKTKDAKSLAPPFSTTNASPKDTNYSTATSFLGKKTKKNNHNNMQKSNEDKERSQSGNSERRAPARLENKLVSSNLPWSVIVKKEGTQAENHDDVPFLSDNESNADSIESPCLSHKDLLYPYQDEEVMVIGAEKYYLPFSSGFDFGAYHELQYNPPVQHQRIPVNQHSSINDLLDECLITQQGHFYRIPKKQRYITNNSHQGSILNLLTQSDQTETTITPSCFKHFDDMMMSTSLYHIREEECKHDKKYPLYNKREWDSIS